MNWIEKNPAGKISVLSLDASCPPGALLESLDENDAVMLDSSAVHPQYGRYSIIACKPLEVLTLRDNLLLNRDGKKLAGPDRQSIWSALSGALSAVKLTNAPDNLEYLPGWIGYVGYEVGRYIEHLPEQAVRDRPLPDLRLAFYDAVLVYDAINAHWQLVELVFDNPPPGAGSGAESLRRMISDASQNIHEAPPAPVELACAAARPIATDIIANFTPDQYQRAVARCLDYIAAGDIFQVNLSQRLTVKNVVDPMSIYRALRRRNPAWYSAYISFESQGQQCAILSSSPELLAHVRGDRIITRPIKGTRKRTGNERDDKKAAAELVASPKDNAELAMIVDLLRNDLGRICRYGTIHVTERAELEVHPTVFHLTATLEGKLCQGVGPVQLLRAMFPGGSITGAPKIRAMEIIDETERLARSVYTGCIGYVGVDGNSEWNIAIRTLVCESGKAHIQVGGGIVADSKPLDEYNETMDKARAMLEAVQQAKTEAVIMEKMK